MRILILPVLLVLTAAWLNHTLLLFHWDVAKADEETRYRRRMSAIYDEQDAAAATAESPCVAVAARSGAE